ncbi:MAG: hypothetical protein ABSC64_22270 [Candidatus Korobacteraceae bacterium]
MRIYERRQSINRLVSEALMSIAPTSTGFESLLQLLASMRSRMAFSAERDQVLFLVATRLAPQFEVMHLQALHATADLTSPAVALQYLSLQFVVASRIKSQSRASGLDLLHEAFRLTSERKTSC